MRLRKGVVLKRIKIRTQKRSQWLDITRQVETALAEAGVLSGMCLVHVPHTTAGVTVNENADPDVQKDVLKFFDQMIPRDWGFLHVEGNSDAHIKASLMGCSLTLPVEEGRLMLGRWQGIYFCEFDGPREREVWIQT